MSTERRRRVIEVRERIVGPTEPRLKTVRPRRLSDYPRLPAVYRDLARRLAGPLLMGPPICDELIALVAHLFTEEEAGVVRHLGLYRGSEPPTWPAPNIARSRKSSRSWTGWRTRSA